MFFPNYLGLLSNLFLTCKVVSDLTYLVSLEKDLGMYGSSVPFLWKPEPSEGLFVLHPFRQGKTPTSAKKSAVTSLSMTRCAGPSPTRLPS